MDLSREIIMLATFLQALINTTILALFAVWFGLLYILVVGNFFFSYHGVSYSFDAPAQIRLSALLLILIISGAIRLLWRGRKRTVK